MKATELREAIAQGKKLIWNDPDPIEGNDYRIDKVTLLYTEDWEEEEDLTASISYGGGSEATVFINEIDYADPLDRMKCVIDQESVDIYIDNGDYQEPTHIVYWHLDEVEEDANVALVIANAIQLFYTNRQELLDRIRITL